MTEIARISPLQILPRDAVCLIQRGDSMFLVTTPQRESKSAQLEFAIPGIETHSRVVKIRAEVSRGALGVGWFDEDEAESIVCRSIGQQSRVGDVELLIPAGTPGGKLIFYNHAEGKTSTRALIRSISIMDWEWDRQHPADLTNGALSNAISMARWRAEIYNGFRIAHRDDVPSGKRIGYFEEVFRAFDDPDEILQLVPPSATIRNFAKNIWEFAKGKTRLTTYPWNVTIPVADLCNARCVFCTSWLDGRKILDVEKLDMFEPVIRHALLIGLVGHGEPLAHPRFDVLCDRLEALCDPASSIYTITNGVFLEKWRDKLERIRLHGYSISLNAATAETHDVVMGLGRDAFPRIIESISHLAALGRRQGEDKFVAITLVVTQQNLHEIPAFIELGNRLEVSEIWLRSLLPQPGLVSGLNYHTVPPYLHPDFERLRRSAISAIQSSQVRVQADPGVWGQPIFSEALEQQIRLDPPPIISREQALRDRELRQRNEYLYHQEKGIFRGRPLADGECSEVRWQGGRLHVVTPKGSGAYAASVAIASPESDAQLHIEVDVRCDKGEIGIGLLDETRNSWLDRNSVEAGAQRAAVLGATVATGQKLRLVVLNGADGGVSAQGSIGAAHFKIDDFAQWRPIEWHSLTTHNAADPLDDGTNPLNRQPRFACKAVYYNLYLNEFFYRVNPCCYLQQVPGFEEVRLDGELTFMEAWNSPGMVELRRRLVEGPLFGACVRCPEKW